MPRAWKALGAMEGSELFPENLEKARRGVQIIPNLVFYLKGLSEMTRRVKNIS